MKNAKNRGYFNSAQAIADYAAVLLHIKKKLKAQKSPVVVIGGSYGGSKHLKSPEKFSTYIHILPFASESINYCSAVLASWFRLKYPHVALGALASSAPILYFDNITPSNGYYSVVTRDFQVIYHAFLLRPF